MYKLSGKILQKYADVLVNFALGGGKGVKRGDVVYVVAYEYAKPLYAELLRQITKAGGNVISHYLPNEDNNLDATRDFFVNAKERQISFFPSKYFRGLVDEIDHYIFIISDTDMEALKGISPKKIMARQKAMKPFQEWRDEKQGRKKFSRTIALYGTKAMAEEAGLSEKQYWRQIIKACFLDERNPILKWRHIEKRMAVFKNRLNRLKAEKMHLFGPDADLWITIGKKRKWEDGGGENIPSFEIFTSPDWRGTQGWINFDNPVFTRGNFIIKGIELSFKNGKVIRAKAKKNEKFLKEMINSPGGNRVGEFSLTDKRFSKITKFMAETLYDENIGGPYGNIHIALGKSYHECYDGNPAKISKKEWQKLGFNDSAIHEDMVLTRPMTVVAHLKNGKEQTVYKNGLFVL
ncbi:MAG: aminopeptidase [Candidatus Nealsonbacteria bacterium CG_4_10_14_0_2_um_filter_40_15]|uniref:Aminopeptidase n=1 Tax=Candidatus Nealsonbacteria bacterium CG_4_10_14_0_2_um_filter_40_15 TaxID=1974682 RepID=A0A2M7UUD3_9BACT|nr:MAG: aminopeptidase [Candidatus Nealsonbacteria bacterium CG_4_10_14_0_2_um_filter_40_15]